MCWDEYDAKMCHVRCTLVFCDVFTSVITEARNLLARDVMVNPTVLDHRQVEETGDQEDTKRDSTLTSDKIIRSLMPTIMHTVTSRQGPKLGDRLRNITHMYTDVQVHLHFGYIVCMTCQHSYSCTDHVNTSIHTRAHGV